MHKFLEIFEKKMTPIMTKMNSWKYLQAIRNGMVTTIPLVIVGSFFLVFINIPIPAIDAALAPYDAILVIPFRLTVYMMAVYAAFGIGASMGEIRGLDSKTSGILALVGFMMTIMPMNMAAIDPALVAEGATATVTSAEVAYQGWMLPYTYLGSAGLFGAIVVSIASVEIMYFMTKKNMVIKMPPGVPESVTASFAALFPTAVVVVLFWTLTAVIGFNIHEFFNILLSPLQDFIAGSSLAGAIFTVLLVGLFWSAGVHGLSVIGGIMRPFWQIALQENMDAIAAGVNPADVPNIITEPFYQWFVWIGGAGATLGLLICIFMVAKSTQLKTISKLSIIPGIFNINEPVIFGLPIVANPMMAIPFIFGPVVITIISYFAIYFDFVTTPYILAPWTLPAPIGAVMATGDFSAVILVCVNLAVVTAIYYPFVKMYDRQLVLQEQEAQQGE